MAKLLEVGDIINIEAGHAVYADVPKHFVYGNEKGNFELCRTDVKVDGQLDYLRGEYIVQRVTKDGGGGAAHDIYPDGHHVWCERVDGKYKVDFYQTGAFTAMIPAIEPVGKAELKYVRVA